MTAEVLDERFVDMVRVMSGLRSQLANARVFLELTSEHLRLAEENIASFRYPE